MSNKKLKIKVGLLAILAAGLFFSCDTSVRDLDCDNSAIIDGFPEELLATLELQNNIDLNNDGKLSGHEAASLTSLDLSGYVCGWVSNSDESVATDSSTGLAVTYDEGVSLGYTGGGYTWTNELSWLDKLFYFTGLESLTIGSENKACALASIDISKLKSLKTLNLVYTNVSVLDLTGHEAITSLTISKSSKISSLNLSQVPNLVSLDIRGCSVKSGLENIPNLTALTNLKIHRLGANNNAVMGKDEGNYVVDLTAATYVNNNNVEALASGAFDKLVNLAEIMAENCGITSINLSACSNLKNIYLEANDISGELDLSGINSGFKNIQLTGNKNLTSFTLPGSKTATVNVYADTGVTCTNADATGTQTATTIFASGKCTTTWN